MRLAPFAAGLALLASAPGHAQRTPTVAVPAAAPAPRAAPVTILFIGNSFTQGAHSAVRNWAAASVTDLNGDGYGGVPALFKAFTQQAGLDYRVSLETQGGKSLGFHFDERRARFDRAWDIVVLQEFSTLNRARPGDPADYVRDVGRIDALLRARNPRLRTWLMATWSRADTVYRGTGPWAGRPIAAMADDLYRAGQTARAAHPGVAGVIPVGLAWNRAFATGVADADPYDGTSFGQLDLWAYDHYHASIAGYYLEALVVFGAVTGLDPTTLGPDESAADALGLSSADAVRLQQVAAAQLRAR